MGTGFAVRKCEKTIDCSLITDFEISEKALAAQMRQKWGP